MLTHGLVENRQPIVKNDPITLITMDTHKSNRLHELQAQNTGKFADKDGERSEPIEIIKAKEPLTVVVEEIRHDQGPEKLSPHIPPKSARKDPSENLSDIVSSQLLSSVPSSIRQCVQIPAELHNRLLRLKVIDQEDRPFREGQYTLNQKESEMFFNAHIFMVYLLTLKKLMKVKCNQDLNINPDRAKQLTNKCTKTERLKNWEIVVQELDKIGIGVDDETLHLIIDEKQDHIIRLFARIDRLSKIIAGAEFMKFENITPEDLYDIYKPDAPLISDSMTMEEMISVASHLIGYSPNPKKSTPLLGSEWADDDKSLNKLPQQLSNQPSELRTLISKGRQQIQRKISMISNQSQRSPQKQARPILQHMFTQGWDQRPNLNQLLKLPSNMDQSQITEQVEETFSETKKARNEKSVKEAVDLIKLDPSKPLENVESSLEFILVTLSRAFSMKPQQAAALLTNTNQYLITVCIKGIKGANFDPILAWYQLLHDNILPLSDLLYSEAMQLPKTAVPTFFKVMAAMGSGFYSNSGEVVKATFDLFAAVYQELLREPELETTAMKWFLMNKGVEEHGAGGLRLLVYAVKQHHEFATNAMNWIKMLCTTDDQILVILRDELKNHMKSVQEYVATINDWLASLYWTFDRRIQVVGLLDYWIEVCAREAEPDGKRTIEERIVALSVLSEIWLTFTDTVDRSDEMSSTIIFMLKRAVRERVRAIRMAASVFMFRLLDQLGEKLNKNAPVIYKTLIFALVENPGDPTMRSFYLSNFKNLFETNKSIPVQLFLEPFLKQLQTSLNVNMSLKVFDFDFFSYISEHPKFNASGTLQLLELLGRIMLNEIKPAPVPEPSPRIENTRLDEFPVVSFYSLAQVPFLQICHRNFQKAIETDTQQQFSLSVTEYLREFISQSFDKLIDLEPISRAEATRRTQFKLKKGNINVTSQRGTSPPKPPLKARELGKTHKQPTEREVNRKLYKSLTIQMLLKIYHLTPKGSLIMEDFKRKAIETQTQFIAIYGYENKGLTQILGLFGEILVVAKQQSSNRAGKNAAIMQAKLHSSGHSIDRGDPLERRLTRNESDEEAKHRKSLGSHASALSRPSDSMGTSQENTNRRDGSKSGFEVAIYGETDAYNDSHALVPFKAAAKRTSKSRPRYRATADIERIKIQKAEREKQTQEEQQRKREASAKLKQAAREQVERRKIALGVADKTVGYTTQLMLQEDPMAKSLKQKQPIALIELMEDEEERDVKPFNHVLHKYQKLWKHLFNKYQSASFTSKKTLPIEALQNKTTTLSLAELNRMLKDHDMMPQLISKEELATLVRLINTKADAHIASADLQSVTYLGFWQLITQLALNCFTRTPHDLTGKPTFEQLHALISTFLTATKTRKLSTTFYEENDGAQTQKEKDMIKVLTMKLETEPNYPLPDGYTKIKEARPVVYHQIPKAVAYAMGQAKTVSVTVLDELVSEVFGFHLIEGKVKIEDRWKVRKTFISQPNAVDQAQAIEIMKRLEEDKESHSTPSIKSKQLNPIDGDSNYRRSKKPQSENSTERNNAATKSRAEQARLKDEEFKEKERRRNERAKKLKSELEKIKEERKAKEEEEKEKRAAEEKRKKELAEEQAEERLLKQEEERQRLLNYKQEKERKLKQETAEKQLQDKALAQQRKAKQQEFFAHQQEELASQFKSISLQRQQKASELSKKEQKEKEQRSRLQEKVATKGQHVKNQAQKEHDLVKVIDEFMSQPEIKQVFGFYDAGLHKLFRFYCKKQNHHLEEDLQFMLEHMHWQQFTKFCYQTKIIPNRATIDDINSTFRIIVSAYRSPDKRSEDQFSPYIDYEMFKRALVRIELIDKCSDDRTREEELTAEIQKQMRAEFTKENAGQQATDLDFEEWMKAQEEKGTGLRQRLLQKQRLGGAKRRIRASSVKRAAADFDINALTADDVEDLLNQIGIGPDGDLDEKMLEERHKEKPDNMAASQTKSLVSRLNMKQQRHGRGADMLMSGDERKELGTPDSPRFDQYKIT